MTHVRQPGISAQLARAARELNRAVRAMAPAGPPTLAELRENAWQLVSLTGGPAELATVLAEDTGYHVERSDRLREIEGGDPVPSLGRACRALTGLRQAADTAQSAAREHYSALSRLTTVP
jgi:phosphoserine phosphatase